ncbi:unnamed protein product [Durusdinium trenchii]|uniref:Uncharacterized protein n=1 Tax=Durusdinium trenchii TaxID=1381693 RepID=A0ABP0L0S6_9DINO
MAEVLESVSEVLEDVAELPRSRRFPPLRLLPPLPGPNMVDAADDVGSSIRTASAPWWEALSDGSNEWSMDEFTEYTLDSQADTSVSSTRASTSATTGSNPRQQAAGFIPGIRGGAGSPHTFLRGWTNTGYRGRSVTRRESQSSGAAMRHRHPTHTPSRPPNPRRILGTAAQSGTSHLHLYHFRPIGRVREEEFGA